MPFMAGINISEADFHSKIFPAMKNTQKNRILIVMLESNTFAPYEFSPEQDLLAPSLQNIWTGFIKESSKHHWIKKSRCIEFEKKESPQLAADVWKFKMRLKPDKKVTKTKPKVAPTLADCRGRLGLTAGYVEFFSELLYTHIVGNLGSHFWQEADPTSSDRRSRVD